ncbi:hypothetical protein HPP92_007918 [Vanilla planifolia]|uniref:Small ribosomal subunit protein uS2c n=1 Tax=Vanilla planifolia TaxID=51239 RepID=A0A835RND3_VANPL|nr:hypothetical protein HPP92_007918 [Vanilla planifolia]
MVNLVRRFRRNNYFIYLFHRVLNLFEKKKTKRKRKCDKMERKYWNINLEEMIKAGVHLGHDFQKWNPRMAPYISAKRKGIHITNLTITARFLSEACDLVFDVASKGKTFLIVGTKKKYRI